MAGTWLMMSIEGPFVAAIIARLDDPKYNLAAFGIAFAVAILFESPVIMILSASTALVEGPRSFRRLRNFTYVVNAGLTCSMLLLLLTPAWRFVADRWIGLPPEVVELSQTGLLIMTAWPAAIGYRRFYHGLLIRHGLTRLVAYSTLVRLTCMTSSSLLLYARGDLPGTWVGAAALTVGVSAEALASRWMVRRLVRKTLSDPPRDAEQDAAVTYRRISSFYLPLAFTSVISLAVQPLVTFAMGHARYSLDSLAVLPAVGAFSFLFRSVGLSFQEVAIALLAEGKQNALPVRRFAARLALGSSLTMALIAFTPLIWIWYRDISNLTAELTSFATLPTRIMTLLPGLSVVVSLQRAILVQARRTVPMTWAGGVEVLCVVLALGLLIEGLDLVGAVAAAIALLLSKAASSLYLMPACARVS
jgi:Na+-driven multidrug efflux pump